MFLTFAQFERLSELLHKRFVGICDLGDPPEGYSWTPYSFNENGVFSDLEMEKIRNPKNAYIFSHLLRTLVYMCAELCEISLKQGGYSLKGGILLKGIP